MRSAYNNGMARLALSLPLIAALAAPAAAQEAQAEPPSLMQRGVEMFLEGLKQEMGPALDDLRGMAEEAGPAFGRFMQEMGPALAEILGRIDDLRNYHMPEMLPNGDIIIRRKTPLAPESDSDGEVEI